MGCASSKSEVSSSKPASSSKYKKSSIPEKDKWANRVNTTNSPPQQQPRPRKKSSLDRNDTIPAKLDKPPETPASVSPLVLDVDGTPAPVIHEDTPNTAPTFTLEHTNSNLNTRTMSLFATPKIFRAPSTFGCSVCSSPLTEKCFLCKTCPRRFEVCEECFLDDIGGHDPDHEFEQMSNEQRMSSVSFSESIKCKGCNELMENLNVMFFCDVCPSFALCSTCFQNNTVTHDVHHKFTETSIPGTNVTSTPSSENLSFERESTEIVISPPAARKVCSQCQSSNPERQWFFCEKCDVAVCGECKPHTPHDHPWAVWVHTVQQTKKMTKQYDSTGNKLINMYTVLKSIGAGSFGKVKLAQHIITRKLFAIKIFNKSFLAKTRRGSTTAFDQVMGEIAIMKRLDHPNVVRLYEVIDDPNHNKLYLILDYVEKGPIFRLGRDNPLSVEKVKFYAIQIASGLRYLHSHQIIHRDIKPDNILVDECGIAKLSDFGVSFVRNQEFMPSTNNDGDGTPMFMTPEALHGKPIPPTQVDMWAFGVTLYVLATGKLPWDAEKLIELRNAVLTIEPSFRVSCPLLENLLRLMLHKDLSERLSLDEFFRHPFICENTDEELLQSQYVTDLHLSEEDKQNAIVVGENINLRMVRTINVFMKVKHFATKMKDKATPRVVDLILPPSHPFSDKQTSSPTTMLQPTPLFDLDVPLLNVPDTPDEDDSGSEASQSIAGSFMYQPRHSYTPCSMTVFRTDALSDSEIRQVLGDPAVTDLILDKYLITELPLEVYFMTNLTTLSCQGCSLERLNPEISILTQLTALNLSDNRITTIPEEIGQLVNLQKLDLSRNVLWALPDVFHKMTALEAIVLDGNHFCEVPVEVCSVPQLTKIFIVENKELRRFPVELRQLKSCILSVDNSPQLFKAWSVVRKHFPGISITWNKIYPDRVIDHLYLGSLRTAQNEDAYTSLHITRILSCGRNLAVINPLPQGVERTEIPLDDSPDENFKQYVEGVVKQLHQWRKEHRVILVHCFAGVSRSAACVIAYLMIRRRMRVQEALTHLQKARPVVKPNEGFMQQLLEIEAELVRKGHFRN